MSADLHLGEPFKLRLADGRWIGPAIIVPTASEERATIFSHASQARVAELEHVHGPLERVRLSSPQHDPHDVANAILRAQRGLRK